jgi:cellulose synthase/poly-beta-1,6-N-acetylglucosamine synthase-like glycosyltransferase
VSAPEVSILVVTYNRAHTLRECIDSIRMQTYPSKEIVVVDDGSTDGTEGVARSYGDAVTYRLREHEGISRSRNAALELARGSFIAYLDSDDYYLSPDVLGEYLDRFRGEPALDAVASGWRVVDSEGRPVCDAAPWEQAPSFDLKTFLYWKPAYPSAKMFRRKVLEDAGGFDPAFEIAVDTDLFLRILLRGARVGWLKKTTCALRQSPDSVMADAIRQSRFLLQALDRAFSSPDLPQDVRREENAVRSSTHLWLAWQLWLRGFPSEASESLRQAYRWRQRPAWIQLVAGWRSFLRSSRSAGSRIISQEEFLGLALPAVNIPAGRRNLYAAFLALVGRWGIPTD